MSQLLRLPLNTQGRDFVVGDIHGYFDLLDRLLAVVGFDPRVDRLISVGDLIDRGPQSLAAAEYLQQPWFFAVRGNHEDLMLDGLGRSAIKYDLWMRVGGGWTREVSPQEVQALCEQCRQLPLAIEVATVHGPVGVVHADLPAEHSWTSLSALMETNRLSKADAQTLVWSRDSLRRLKLAQLYPGSLRRGHIDGVHRLYSGHNIVDAPVAIGNHWLIDTGVYHPGGRLTLVDLNSEEISSLAAD